MLLLPGRGRGGQTDKQTNIVTYSEVYEKCVGILLLNNRNDFALTVLIQTKINSGLVLTTTKHMHP